MFLHFDDLTSNRYIEVTTNEHQKPKLRRFISGYDNGLTESPEFWFSNQSNKCWKPQHVLFKKVESDKVECKDIRKLDR